MDLEVIWKRQESRTNHDAKLGVVNATELPGANKRLAQEHEFVESFCLPSFFVSVSYDAIPLRSVSISVSIPRPIRLASPQMPIPVRVHYGISISCVNQWRGSPQDSYFSEEGKDSCIFYTHIDVQSFHTPVLGLSFVIQLENGQWVKDFNCRDFYVGGGDRALPCGVEIPFSWPCAEDVVHGQLLTLYRTNPFWLQPLSGESMLCNSKDESLFALAALTSSHASESSFSSRRRTKFGALLATVDHKKGVRACFFGVRDGKYSGIRIETGRCSPLSIHEVRDAVVMITTTGTNPYDLVERLVQAASEELRGFSSRVEKTSSKRWQEINSLTSTNVLNSLGYCTWDAYGHEVDESNVANALQWLTRSGISIGFVIVDDGWQGGGGDGPNCEGKRTDGRRGRPPLKSFSANDKFSRSLQSLSKQSSASVIAWTSAIGYWGGVSGSHCNVDTTFVRGVVSSGLHRNSPPDASHWEMDYEVVSPCEGAVNHFFENYFVDSMGCSQGIKGAKVDSQSILEILCNLPSSSSNRHKVSRASLAMMYRKAISAAAEKAFPEQIVINCMACGSETILSSGEEATLANVCWRTSNDHAFPGVEESADSVAWHIISNVSNTLFLGEVFPVPDWDMFRSCNQFARIHAAARVLSGGPVYVSDVAPFPSEFADDAVSLLQSLTSPEGKVLRCENPGRPTLDCMFIDPRVQPVSLYKIFNRSAVVGVLGIFNLSSSCEDVVGGSFAPADVNDFGRCPRESEYVSLICGQTTGAFLHASSAHHCNLALSSMTFALVHISPVISVEGIARIAVMGQLRIMNVGATVRSISVKRMSSLVDSNVKRHSHCVECSLNSSGDTYVWLDPMGEANLATVTICDGLVPAHHRRVSMGDVNFLVVEVQNQKPYNIQLYFGQPVS